jgi:CHAD domain-containing protein
LAALLSESIPPLLPDDPVRNAVVSALQSAVLRIEASDVETRRGDGEAIHRLRTSIRRLRSELLALKDFVDQPWRAQIEDELKWLGGLLGGVRDLDILMARLRKSRPSWEEDGSGAGVPVSLFPALRARRAQAAQALDDALASDRYRSLLVALRRAAERPALRNAANEACSVSLPRAAATAWRRLKKAARDLRPSHPDEEALHEVRKRAKRARYTAELVAPVLRRGEGGARRFIKLTTQIQDALGEHQDAMVAVQEIQNAVAAHADDHALVQSAESLIQTEHESARAARALFFKIWEKLDRKKSQRWMKTQPKANVETSA